MEWVYDQVRNAIGDDSLIGTSHYLRAMIDSNPIARLVVDTETGKIVDANPAAGLVFNAMVQNLIGQKASKVCHNFGDRSKLYIKQLEKKGRLAWVCNVGDRQWAVMASLVHIRGRSLLTAEFEPLCHSLEQVSDFCGTGDISSKTGV